jgi:hypothetical protein
LTAGDLIERAASRWGDLVCIRHDDRTLTCAEVGAGASQIAQRVAGDLRTFARSLDDAVAPGWVRAADRPMYLAEAEAVEF